MMNRWMAHWFYPFAVGILFGVVQTAYFIQLNFELASTYGTFLMVTLAWFTGSIVGLRLSQTRRFALSAGPLICILPYLVTLIMLGALPFQADVWPLYSVLVLVSGVFSGLFFGRLAEIVQPVRRLFFMENNGFLAGIAICTLAFLLLGRTVLWVLPMVLAVICWASTPRQRDRLSPVTN
jgi:hypothetical protein